MEAIKEQNLEMTPQQEMEAQRRQMAAIAIQKHFNSHPDAVMIVSMREGRVQCDVTPFPDLGSLCFAREILKKQFDNSFEGSLAQNRKQAEADAAIATAEAQGATNE